MQHVTRINGSIPTYNDASADHQCLLDRWEEKCHLPLLWLYLVYYIELMVCTINCCMWKMWWFDTLWLYEWYLQGYEWYWSLSWFLVLIMWQRLRMQSFVEQFYWNFLIDYCLLTSTHCFGLTISNVTSKMSCGFFSDM